MVYAFIKIVVRVALRVFFKNLTIKHLERIPSKGPLIVVANHPNTFMDPIAIACFMKQPIYFLTKGAVFNSPMKKWLFSQMNMVPVYRKQDLQPGEQADNDAVFKQCFDFLAKGGTLMIFPEGVSIKERRLKPLKTGTARIALGAENKYDFSLGLQIVSVGLNYSESNRFRSELVVDVDEPLKLKDWQQTYQKDEQMAVKQLTAKLTASLQSHTIETVNEEEDQLAQEIAALYEEAMGNETNEWDEGEEHYQISKHAVQALRYFKETKPEWVEGLSLRIRLYANTLRRLKLKNALLGQPADKNLLYTALTQLLMLLVGFPLYAFGIFHHYIPYLIPEKIAKAVTQEVEYHAPMMMVIGIFSFGLAYTSYLSLAYFWWGLPWLIYVLYAVLLPISGFFCLYYWGSWLRIKHQLWLFSLFYKKSHLVAQLLQQREQLIKDLNQARNEYLSSLNS